MATKKTKSVSTKKPTGLNIVRNGNRFTCTWKQADDNYKDGQQIKINIQYTNGSWSGWGVPFSAGTSNTSYSFTISEIKSIAIKIRGKRTSYTKTTGSGKNKTITTYKPAWSDWAEKSYTMGIPGIPALTASHSDQTSDVTTFNWSLSTSNTDAKPFMCVEFQTMLVRNCNTTNGASLSWSSSQLGWQRGTGGASESKVIQENTTYLAASSCTRWIRVRSIGWCGASAWQYAKYTYARPNQAQITSANAKLTGAGGFQCDVRWSVTANNAAPISKTECQYAIVTPNAELTCPSGASWTTANITVGNYANNGAAFSIDDTLDSDQCLFIRVNTIYGENTTYGQPVMAYAGKLADPSGVSVETDNTTHRATITATNNSGVSDSFLIITYRGSNKPSNSFICGIIPHGQSSVTIQCPNWSSETAVAFGVAAVVGSYTRTTRADGADSYAVTQKMSSAKTIWEGGTVPQSPTNVSVQKTALSGTVRVSWDWSWEDANSAIISWADHEDAWESTDEPNTYTISNLHQSQWNISGLDTGKTWYVAIKLLSGTGDNITQGPWSEPISIDLSSAPNIPVMTLSDSVITEDGSVTAYWGYSSTDGTGQSYAEVCEASVTGGIITYGSVIASTESAQHITINAEDAGWKAGNTYNLCVRVTSRSGKASDEWSAPVPVIVAEPLICEISATSLKNIVIPVDDEGTTREVMALTDMPLTLTVTGAEEGGTTTVIIERAQAYNMDRPDESTIDGYEGETIAQKTITGEAEISIDNLDLIGRLDDGAKYRIVAEIQDGLGQTAKQEQEFEVHWSHQAIIPDATVVMDLINNVAQITPVAPEGTLTGDTCDIYRLSVDKPELIVKDADWGETYIDPYPAIGEFGGHRIVFKTSNGDYITEDNHIAWKDLSQDDGDILDIDYAIIDFDGYAIPIRYNTALSNSWKKDFEETKYLGGSIRGDWNKATDRSVTINAVVTTLYDQEVITALRRLAVYSGICHVRTQDGSSYAADIQVSDEISYEEAGKVLSFTLSVTRVDSEGFEGITLDAWEEYQG